MDDAEAVFPAQTSFSSAPTGSVPVTHEASIAEATPVAAPIPTPAPAVNPADFGDLD